MECVEFACQELGIKREVIVSPCRINSVVAKRWMIICFLYELGFNYNQIGRKVNRNHQVVMNAVKKADVNAWHVGRELLKKYDSLMSPKKKVPNYKSSRVEVVKC
jgi:chromosomal replication initiation ATPase DnaA